MKITVRLSDSDVQRFNLIASQIKNDSPSVVIHYALAATAEASPMFGVDKSIKENKDIHIIDKEETKNPYEGWTKLSSGNDPERGDWKKIRNHEKVYREKVLWYGDDGYNDF